MGLKSSAQEYAYAAAPINPTNQGLKLPFTGGFECCLLQDHDVEGGVSEWLRGQIFRRQPHHARRQQSLRDGVQWRREVFQPQVSHEVR